MKKLALTMIVRDEAARLSGFLAHHEGLFDEIVIVDTGSGDETVTLARQAGATVVERAWDDDFAAPRNLALARATAAWALILDADERICRGDFPALRAALESPADRVYMQETWNYCLGRHHLEWEPLSGRYPDQEKGQTGMFRARRVGLFPLLDGLVFSGRVHESVLPAAESLGLQVVPLPVPVHHYGYAQSADNNAQRHIRYRRLVELKHADDPADPAGLLEMATVLLESCEPEAAMGYLQRLAGGTAGLRPVVRGTVLLGRLRREMGDVVAARELLDRAIRQDPGFRFAWLERIRVERQEGAWRAAEKLLTSAEQRFGARETHFLREALLIRMKTGQFGLALQAGDDLVRLCPQWHEIREITARLRNMMDPSAGA